MSKAPTEIDAWINGTKLFPDNMVLQETFTKYLQPELQEYFHENKHSFGSLFLENPKNVQQILKQLTIQPDNTKCQDSELESSVETITSIIKEEINKCHNQIEKLYELNIITENEYTEYCTYLNRMKEMNNEPHENINGLTKFEDDEKK
ncbi:hypothetical protein KM1_306170 [Entamoeba histolytica HM-3:IMSS]|uniref:Uncharacterized protein n=4 Tax=Entamoeba histolytica TaxID=5759 RepID=C4M1L9_ENTH1|nr:hypothetical protein EHI_133770 [Entamoeba histolytica HM-1:IMSS]EAL50044.1 hypothetical protein EHI_133770 [Entamoeba histolytica HM-1:IMSS]EMD45127.1 Hypothetical protein EHI5A_038890 [Entamoeba histolytica KU27]EMS11868.1 hypothetical protein KM1_306170 [Entamoeba histolytica HM-3:IMSS]GAT95120.1 hypothetical protein CL6EHI_133770 [Entamoeba histolytica]|eukprot:XP_655430.1 hypothetical protein EHI_133770 [Entamoeba histolytica HM-1:IMSS]